MYCNGIVKKRYIVFIVLAFLIGSSIGIVLGYNRTFPFLLSLYRFLPVQLLSSPDVNVQRQTHTYKYTNPLLDCDVADSTLLVHLRPFDDALDSYLSQIEKRSGILNVAVRFRDMIGGRVYSYNGDTQFSPASLLKVPLLIAHLKRAEKDPTYLKQQVTYSVTDQPDVHKDIVEPGEPVLEVGKQYAVEDLLKDMIIYSGNGAASQLSTMLTDKELDQVSTDLGVKFVDKPGVDLFVSVTDYASFFRVLYNSSYLRPDLSEYALDLLVQSTYDKGLVAGVPKGTPVANKFGERFDPASGKSQLHDCGIVYYSKRPYLLCVMTHGDSFPILETAISDISKFVYQKMADQYGK